MIAREHRIQNRKDKRDHHYTAKNKYKKVKAKIVAITSIYICLHLHL